MSEFEEQRKKKRLDNKGSKREIAKEALNIGTEFWYHLCNISGKGEEKVIKQ